jgi:hypothetical protein
LLSKTEYDTDGGETVHATITNDWTKDASGQPIFGHQYAYQVSGFQLHGPIPSEPRGGYGSAEDAEAAARHEYREWRAGNVPLGTKVKRQEKWEMQYRVNRYLRHLSDEELGERLGVVMNNLMNLTHDQKITPIPMDQEGESVSAMYAHVMEEFRLRRSGVTDREIQQFRFPNYDWPGITKAYDAFNALNITPGEYLVKYSKREYIQAAFERGEIRISPASRYNDHSLNYSIMDDELSLALRPPDITTKDTTKVVATGTDYYVCCLANEFSLRLFGDFEADACLVITEPHRFINRLFQAVYRKLFLWQGYAKPVQYIDPVKPQKADMDIYCSKNFRYAYQREYRIIWRPISPRTALPYLHVQIGSLEDCCKVVSLTDT